MGVTSRKIRKMLCQIAVCLAIIHDEVMPSLP